MEFPKNYEYFEKETTNISEKLIKEQGPDICRKMIDSHYINIQVKDYTFGFLHKVPIAQIGQKSHRSPTYNISSFVLCKLHPEIEHVDISLICSRPNAKDGKKLIELATQKSIELDYKYLSLLSIGEPKLVNWYKSQGFIVVSEKMYPNGELKAYSMIKQIKR